MTRLSPRSFSLRPGASTVTAIAACALVLSGCTLAGDDESDEGSSAEDDSAAASGTAPANDEVTLVSHDSFNLPEDVLQAFTDETGYEVTVQTMGDAGSLVNQLVLTSDSPVGDVVFGVDTSFASRTVNEGVLASYSPDLPQGAEQHALDGEGAEMLTPISYGDVCVNIDDQWFADEGIEPPETLQDLTESTYEDLFVTPGASTSSPGLSFLLATVGEFGQDGWQDYWEELMANGTAVTNGWTDAYTVDFTAGGGDGDRPIVLSYASSPPVTIPEGGDEPTTSALLETCFRQVEYAGVLQGAENEPGAQALVDFLLSDQVQAAIPDAMYVYPASEEVELPELWEQWADVAQDPIEVPADEIEQNREEWIQEWADIATQ